MYFVKSNDKKRNSNFLDDFSNLWNGSIFCKDMKTDIEETDKEYKVTVDLPGIEKKDISLAFEENVLKISVNQTTTDTDKEASYIKRERSVLQMSREYYLELGDEKDIHAKLNDGVLSVVIGKTAKSIEQKKIITIE